MERNNKIILGLICGLLLCIVALALLLPHPAPSTARKSAAQPQTPANGTANIVSPVTTSLPSTTVNQTANVTTTITSSNSSQSTNSSFNYTNYLNQLTNPNNLPTTTILYVYCVGGLTPPFNQSYYSQLDQGGAELWNPTTSYPTPFIGGSCASTGGTVYCLSDSGAPSDKLTTQVYYAGVSSKGIGQWTQTTSYPVPFSYGSCAAYNGYMYCIGATSEANSMDVFYASISSGGVGAWKKTTSFPGPFYRGQCNSYSGYIYCIGDAYLNSSAIKQVKNITTANQVVSNGDLFPLNMSYDYYAPISASGVGQWKRITHTPIPIDGGSCTISNATIYCIGGSSAELAASELSTNYTYYNSSGDFESTLSQLFANDTSSAFYAPIGANGSVGGWTATLSYPTLLQEAQCTTNGSYIYCVGGASSPQEVFYSSVFPGIGIEDWIQTNDYPIPLYSGYCSTNSKA